MISYFLDEYAVVGGRCRVVQPVLCSWGEGEGCALALLTG